MALSVVYNNGVFIVYRGNNPIFTHHDVFASKCFLVALGLDMSEINAALNEAMARGDNMIHFGALGGFLFSEYVGLSH